MAGLGQGRADHRWRAASGSRRAIVRRRGRTRPPRRSRRGQARGSGRAARRGERVSTVADVTDEGSVKAGNRRRVDHRSPRRPVQQRRHQRSGQWDRRSPVGRVANTRRPRPGASILKHGAPHVPMGSIIITSSVVGLIGFEGLPAHRRQVRQVGLMRAPPRAASRRIRVNSLHPGPTSTGRRAARAVIVRSTTAPRNSGGLDAFRGRLPTTRKMVTGASTRSPFSIEPDVSEDAVLDARPA